MIKWVPLILGFMLGGGASAAVGHYQYTQLAQKVELQTEARHIRDIEIAVTLGRIEALQMTMQKQLDRIEDRVKP